MSDNTNLFPTLGEIATRTNDRADLPEGQMTQENDEDEDRDMQEIESLCMRCHEQVSQLCLDHITICSPSFARLELGLIVRASPVCSSPPSHTSKKSSYHPSSARHAVIGIRRFSLQERSNVRAGKRWGGSGS